MTTYESLKVLGKGRDVERNQDKVDMGLTQSGRPCKTQIRTVCTPPSQGKYRLVVGSIVRPEVSWVGVGETVTGSDSSRSGECSDHEVVSLRCRGVKESVLTVV